MSAERCEKTRSKLIVSTDFAADAVIGSCRPVVGRSDPPPDVR